MTDRVVPRAFSFVLFASLAATLASTSAAQGQPTDSPAASTAIPPTAPPPAQANPPAAAQPTAPPAPHPYGYPAYGPPAGYAPPGVYGPPPPPPPPEEDKGRIVSLTFSPLHVILPVFELTAEFRAHDHVGIALLGGYGKVKTTSLGRDYKFDVFEFGGQLLFYPISKFDKGLQLGAEALYVKVKTDDDYSGKVTVSGAGSGLAVGPLVGYKVCTSGGFTFVAQGGVQFMTLKASDSNGGEEEASDVIPLLNLNIGWSF